MGNSMISVGQLAEIVQGEIVNCSERSGEEVKSLMVGAMCIDPTPLYFGTKSDKAVITRGDRVDIQLGALATSTKCLILTGGVRPSSTVLDKAEESGVPIIVVGKNTPVTLAQIEESLGWIDTEVVDAEASNEESPTVEGVT